MDRSFNRERFFLHNAPITCRSPFHQAQPQQPLYQPLPIFDQRIIPAVSVSAAPHFRPAHHPSSLCISRSPFSTSASSQQPLYQPLPIFDQHIIPAASVSAAPHFRPAHHPSSLCINRSHFRPAHHLSSLCINRSHFRPAHHLSSLCNSRSPFST